MVEEQTPEARFYTEAELQAIVEAEFKRVQAEHEASKAPMPQTQAIVPVGQPTVVESTPVPEQATSHEKALEKEAQEFDVALRQLSLNQQRFLALRSLYPSDTKTAEVAGVSRSTVNNWKRDPEFMHCYSSMHVYLSSALKRLLVANGVLAADRTTGLLSNPETHGDVLVRIIQTAFGALGLGKKAAPVLQQQINVNAGPRDFDADVINRESAKRGLPPLTE